jgi:hypothetical protein
MSNKAWRVIMLGALLVTMAMLAGCGGGSMATNGTLTVAEITAKDLTNGYYSVETTATFAPNGLTALPGTEIRYTVTYAGSNTTTSNGKGYTDSTGAVNIANLPTITQSTVPTKVTITASTGGLSSTKTASVPAIAALTLTPVAVSFLSTDTAGTTASVAITGGFSPYTVSSATAADIGVAISGSTVTITKLTASGLTNTSTTVTVTDNKSTQQSVVVGYYK